MSNLNYNIMKTLKTNTIKMIVAIILLVTVSTTFAQNFAPNFIEERNSAYTTSQDGFVVIPNKGTVDIVIPNYEGEFILEVYDITCQRVYSNVFSNSSNQTISIPINDRKSKILLLTITGRDFKVSRKFYVS